MQVNNSDILMHLSQSMSLFARSMSLLENISYNSILKSLQSLQIYVNLRILESLQK